MKDLSETVSQMTSKDYRERFKAEYSQTKFRYERLKDYCNKSKLIRLLIVLRN